MTRTPAPDPTISDAGSRGQRSDSSSDLIPSWAKEHGYAVAERAGGVRDGLEVLET